MARRRRGATPGRRALRCAAFDGCRPRTWGRTTCGTRTTSRRFGAARWYRAQRSRRCVRARSAADRLKGQGCAGGPPHGASTMNSRPTMSPSSARGARRAASWLFAAVMWASRGRRPLWRAASLAPPPLVAERPRDYDHEQDDKEHCVDPIIRGLAVAAMRHGRTCANVTRPRESGISSLIDIILYRSTIFHSFPLRFA